uniref:Uncharacterized protein n=1 Tax=viral metagenome TaxID=1070528 RepID=A0A6C0AYJ3_9ZZZZ|tara:strand:- start:2674 stop:3087 length:414 start_codon:yes stop_codon:yes gene_type:complete
MVKTYKYKDNYKRKNRNTPIVKSYRSKKRYNRRKTRKYKGRIGGMKRTLSKAFSKNEGSPLTIYMPSTSSSLPEDRSLINLKHQLNKQQVYHTLSDNELKDILIKLDFHVGRSVNCVKSLNPAYGYNKEVACNRRNN